VKGIIDNYLSGKLNDEECRILIKWLDEGKENVKYFREYCKEWNVLEDESVEESWNAFQVKKQLRDNSSDLQLERKLSWGKRAIQVSRIQLIKYAAILAIGLLLSVFVGMQISEYFIDESRKPWVTAETLSGQKTKIVLPDSSVVWLNSETSISFPSDFESRRKRIIKLEGEAYFDVAKQGASKFTVICPDYEIEVRGTKFNVMAYKDFDRTETTLVEGAVLIRKGSQVLSLKPGERAVFSKNYLTKSKAQVRQATLWKDNKFYFDNIPLRELIRRLERWYDVKITLKDSSLKDIYYSGYFKNEETVWQVLDVIKMTTPILYERNQFREITIARKKD
jgi:ferric-dicitrate binding protein FerR (iron transport regulator)